MVSGLFHIRINSDETNKDNGFFTLMTSGAKILCLDDEEYVIPEEALENLQKKKIDFEIITKKREKNKQELCKEDASKT